MSRYLSLSLLALSAVSSAKFSAEFVSYDVDPSAKSIEIPAAEVALPIIGTTARSSFKKHMMHSLQKHATGNSHISTLAGSSMDEEYLVNVTIGNQHFPVIVDTGRYVNGASLSMTYDYSLHICCYPTSVAPISG